MRRQLSAVLAVALFPLAAWGQAVPSREPTSTHIFPAGGQRGTVVKVRVGGECMPPGMAFQLTGAGVTGSSVLGAEAKPRYEPSARRPPRDADGVGAAMTYPREWESSVTIDAEAERGMKFWRVSGAWGGTRPRPFLVGDLPEHVETEPNSTPERAERITLPVVVNGQIAGERDQDFFVFAAAAGDVVVCDVMAARIGSPLDPVVAITDTHGRRQDVQEVRVGNDPVLAFRVPATGDYRLHVANLGFGGGPAFVYRITLSTKPFAVHAFPPGGRVGETRDVTTYTLTGTAEFVVSKEKVTFPAEPGPFLHRGRIPLVAGELPEVAETDDNHAPETAMALAVPVTVNARFLAASEEDWFRFTAKKGEAFTIACRPFAGGSAALPVLALLAENGAVLLNATAVDSPDGEILLDWKAPADGVYRLRLRDIQHGSRGGHDFLYVLTVCPARPDFTLRLAPDFVNVVQGGKTEIDLHVQRTGGFTGPIDLTAAGLPDGVKIEPARVADNQTRLKLTVSATNDARPADVLVTLRGTATIDGKPVARRAAVPTIGTDRESLHLTVQHKPVFKITCNEAYQYAPRGSIHFYPVTIERLNGFAGPITLQLCERQVQDLDGIEGVETVVPAGVTAATFPIHLPETMHAGAQHHSRPYAQGYATFTDQWGTKQTTLAVCDKRCMVRTTPPVAKLRAVTPEVAAAPGGMIECKVALDRTSNFTAPADIELLAPPGFTAPTVHLEAGQTEAVVRVQVDRLVKRPDNLTLTFRATGKLPSGGTAVTEASVPVAVAAEPSPTGPWDVKSLQAVVVKPTWGVGTGKAREVFYPGEPFNGKPTRVFAYYAKPDGDGPFPAVLLVHGGGGKAFPKWAEHWAARGYCALAMDLAGNGPSGRLPDGGPDQSDDVKFRDFDDATAKDMWTYHAVAAVTRGHNLLRGLPEVDRERVGVTGISWGGYLTCIVAGLDDRLKAAVPVYGCGFLHENSAWKEARFDRAEVARRGRWVGAFDPSRYLGGVKCPILFLNGTNDFAYPLDSYQKSYQLVKDARAVSVRVRLPHGHIWTFGEVDAFIDSHLKKGDPLPTVGEMTRDGDTVSAPVTSKVKLKAATLHYAAAVGPWQKRAWKSVPAELKDGRAVAKLPADRPLVYFLAVTDDRGLEVSAPHDELKAKP